MRRAIESIPILLLTGFYTYILWFLLWVVGVSHLSAMGWVLVVSILPTYVGAFWFLFGEPEGKKMVLVMMLMMLPFLFLFAMVIGAILRPWLPRSLVLPKRSSDSSFLPLLCKLFEQA